MMGGQDLLNKDELTIKVMFGFQKVLRNFFFFSSIVKNKIK